MSAGDGDLRVAASDTSHITADAQAAAVAASLSGGKGGAGSIGLSLAHNSIDTAVTAFIKNAGTIDVGGNVVIRATNDAQIKVQSIAVAVSVAVSGGTPAFALAGGGSESTNVILSTTSAYLQGGSLGTTANKVGSVTITATSGGKVEALVLAVAAAVSSAARRRSASPSASRSRATSSAGIPTAPPRTTYLSTLTRRPSRPASASRSRRRRQAPGRCPAYARSGDVYEYIGTTPLTGPVYDYLSTETRDGRHRRRHAREGTRRQGVYRYDPSFDYVSTQTVSGGIAVNTLVLRDGRIYRRTGAAFAARSTSRPRPTTTATGGRSRPRRSTSRSRTTPTRRSGRRFADGVDLVSMDYSDTTLWKLVGVDRTGAVVEAAVKNASIHATGAADAHGDLDANDRRDRRGRRGRASAAAAPPASRVSGAGAYAENRIATDVQAKIDGDGATGITSRASRSPRPTRPGSGRSSAPRRSPPGSAGRRASRSRSGSRSRSTRSTTNRGRDRERRRRRDRPRPAA